MTPIPERPRWSNWLLWFVILAASTGALLLFRDRLDKAHVALAFVLVVLGGSAVGGGALGIALATTAFVVFDVAFLPPYNTLRIADPLDWFVLFAFLVTSVVGAQLLERQRREADIARSRTAEIDRLATLGAETLNAPRAEDALHAIAEVIRQSMGTERCEITMGEAEGTDSVLPVREMNIPLAIRGIVVGTLRLGGNRPFRLSRDQQRILGALSYYAALGVERVRLAESAEEAESLRRADRLKDALLASVSHDLRTPLTTIKGIANEIARGSDVTRAWVIEEEADRLSTLVDELLDLSQLNAGQMPVEVALNTADDVVGAALQRVESALGGREIDTILEGEFTTLLGRFDFVHTMRILSNLLENAAKYAPAGQPVRLRVSRHGSALIFSVEDAGRIAAEDRERIFEPFARGRPSAKGSRGTGLGLSIARRLAEVQCGTLEFSPMADGSSRFILAVPAADVPIEGSL